MSDNETITLSSRQLIPAEYAGWTLPEAIKALAGKWQTIVIHGGPGTKKTTQLWTIKKASRDPVYVMSEAADIDAHRFSMPHTEAWAAFRGILCIDDVGYKRSANDWNMQVLFAVLNHRRANGLRTVITTNFNREKIKEIYGDHIASRIFGDREIDAGKVDMRGKVAAASWNEQPRKRIEITDGEKIGERSKSDAQKHREIIEENQAYYRTTPPRGPIGKKSFLMYYKIQVKGISCDVLDMIYSFPDYVQRIDNLASLPEKERTQDALLAAFGLHLSPGKAPEPVRAPAPKQSISDLIATLL
jgi:hypothetical protein